MEKEELMSFPRTVEVLGHLADDVRAGYIDQLKKHGHPTKYGTDRLSDTITAEVTMDGRAFTASLNMNYYWKYLEEGTRPHWPPSSAILNWVQIKPVIPRPDGNGRIPTQKQLAFLISRKIAEHGTEGTHGFETAREAILPAYYEKIEQALAEDVGAYVKAVLAW